MEIVRSPGLCFLFPRVTRSRCSTSRERMIMNLCYRTSVFSTGEPGAQSATHTDGMQSMFAGSLFQGHHDASSTSRVNPELEGAVSGFRVPRASTPRVPQSPSVVHECLRHHGYELFDVSEGARAQEGVPTQAVSPTDACGLADLRRRVPRVCVLRRWCTSDLPDLTSLDEWNIRRVFGLAVGQADI